MDAKEAFKQHARSMGVCICQYHYDNGRFADNTFLQSCEQNSHHITLYGVNAHFQNGIAERYIRDLTEQGRKMLLFAMGCWPSAVDISLWVYAIRLASYVHNTVPCGKEGWPRTELFGGLSVRTNLKNYHTFGCPVYVLNNALTSAKDNWKVEVKSSTRPQPWAIIHSCKKTCPWYWTSTLVWYLHNLIAGMMTSSKPPKQILQDQEVMPCGKFYPSSSLLVGCM